MKLIDKYNSYKEKYKHAIIILKEGIFYKTFYDDAKILWYLFDYKYINDTISFGNAPYDKVILKLNKLDISYVVIDNDGVALSHILNEEAYLSYEALAKKSYSKAQKTEQLMEKLQKIMTVNPNYYDEIDSLLNKFLP